VIPYLISAFVFLGIQYLVGPSLIAWTMKVKWVSKKEVPTLHQMVAELAESVHLPKPRVGISEINIPNASALWRYRLTFCTMIATYGASLANKMSNCNSSVGRPRRALL
jgi:Zn-dependent protease with chaperone function